MVWLLLVLYIFVHIVKGFENEPIKMPELYLTVSSLFKDVSIGSVLIDREIVIHWTDDNLFDQISLFNTIPETDVKPVLTFNPKQFPKQYVETNISLENPKFPEYWTYDIELSDDREKLPPLGDYCLPIWAVGTKNNSVVTVDCIKVRPTWMQENRLSIGNLALTSLLLPGTHNSACYKRGETLSYKDLSGRYILTQDQTIWNQLVYGIRYFDFRIGFYPSKQNNSNEIDKNCFWINHDLIKIRQLDPVIKQLKEFLDRAKDEVIIVDFHRFPLGFSYRFERHLKFVRYLEDELISYAIPHTNKSITLNDIWETDKRLIISYGEETIRNEFNWLWPPIRQIWGNKQKVDDLYNFLDECMKNETVRSPKKGMWAAMAQLTPNPLDLLFHPKGSLRHMAHSVNKNLTKWCRDEWWDKANIIATDFFLETDIINIAVAANVIKGDSPNHYLIE